MLISGLMRRLKARDEQSPLRPHSSTLLAAQAVYVARGVTDRVESLRYPTLCRRLFVLRDTCRMLINRYG